MTETQRAAMQQALEAVKKLNSALAEQRAALNYLLLNHTQGELIARLKSSIDDVRLQTLDALKSGGASLNSLRAALAEPEPEPVADEMKAQAFDALNRMSSFRPMNDGRNPRVVLHAFIQLASAPPTRQPLTPAQEHADELLEVLTELANSLPSAEYMRQQGQEEGPLLRKMRAVIAKATGENK